MNTTVLTEGTPLKNIFENGRIDTSCCKTMHLSDIYRILVLYRLCYNHLFKDTDKIMFFSHFRYGGWYTDLDTVTLRRTDLLKNAVANSQGLIGNFHCLSLRLCI